MLADGAALPPGHAQIQSLEFDPRYPNRGEEVAVATPDNRVGTESVTKQPWDKGCDRDAHDDEHRLPKSPS
jgi:hypothetical protein